MTCTTISPPPHTQHDTSLEHSTHPSPAASHTAYTISPTDTTQLIHPPSYHSHIWNILLLTYCTQLHTSPTQRNGNHTISPPSTNTPTSKSNHTNCNAMDNQTQIDNPNHASPSPTQTTGPISLPTFQPNTHPISTFPAQHQTITSDLHSTTHHSSYTMACTP